MRNATLDEIATRLTREKTTLDSSIEDYVYRLLGVPHPLRAFARLDSRPLEVLHHVRKRIGQMQRGSVVPCIVPVDLLPARGLP